MYSNRFADYLEAKENDGSLDIDFMREIKDLSEEYRFVYKRVKESKANEYLKAMDNGAAIILAHVDTTYRDINEWHYSFWFMENGKLKGVNVFSEIAEPVVTFRNYDYFKYLCNKSTGRLKSDGWIIMELGDL